VGSYRHWLPVPLPKSRTPLKQVEDERVVVEVVSLPN
jgi:hypothetical protein